MIVLPIALSLVCAVMTICYIGILSSGGAALGSDERMAYDKVRQNLASFA